MFDTRLISVPIARPYAEAYEFLAEPLNISSWAPVTTGMHHLGGMDYAVELPVGKAILRFTPKNEFGVLDYWLTPDDGSPTNYVPVRLVANDDGCELQYLAIRRAGMTEDAFESRVEWTTADLLVLKSLLESNP